MDICETAIKWVLFGMVQVNHATNKILSILWKYTQTEHWVQPFGYNMRHVVKVQGALKPGNWREEGY